jgi:hypothetical protein
MASGAPQEREDEAMNAMAGQITPEMQELNLSNHLLGDQKALQNAWDRDGYWFFRNVLDRGVISRIRGLYMQFLADHGVADTSDPLGRYNGGDLSKLPKRNEPLATAQVYRELHESPEINSFFTKLFCCDPFWLPINEYRTAPPIKELTRSRFDFIHEDGTYNEGLPFLICWVPLAEIDDAVGGLAVVEGLHKSPCLHRKEGMKIIPIDLNDVPAGTWRRTTYQPGDVLLMDRHTPHSGIANLSDRLRLSLDTRILPSNAPDLPIVGTLTSIDGRGLCVRDGHGEHQLKLDENSFVRGLHGDQMSLDDIPVRYAVGDPVIIATVDGRVANMRPQH